MQIWFAHGRNPVTALIASQRANERRRSAQHGGVRSIGWLAFILATLLEWSLIRLRKC